MPFDFLRDDVPDPVSNLDVVCLPYKRRSWPGSTRGNRAKVAAFAYISCRQNGRFLVMVLEINKWSMSLLVVAAVTALCLVGCSGDDGAASQKQTPQTPDATVSTASPTVDVPTATAAPQELSADAAELAKIHEAALKRMDGVLVPPSSRCTDSDRSCVVELTALPASAAEGMVRLGGFDPGGQGTGWIILGRHADDSWGVFLVANALMPPTTPSMAGAQPLGYVCDAPEGLNVRAQPTMDSEVLGSLTEGTEVQIEQFQLQDADDGEIGTGWYKISSPQSGWVFSDYLSNVPSLDTCLNRYAVKRQPTTE